MFLKISSLRVKLIFYSLFLSMAVLIISYLVFYISLSKLWREKDNDILKNKTEHYAKLYLENTLTPSIIDESLMVRVFSKDKEEIFHYYPSHFDHDDKSLLKKLKKEILLKKGKKIILLEEREPDDDFFESIGDELSAKFLEYDLPSLATLFDNDIYEIYTKELPNELLIVVGTLSEEREEALEDLRSIAGTLVIPCLLFTFFLSWFLSGLFLKPIKEFRLVINRMKKGEKALRPTLSKSHDEIDILKKEFIELVDQNESLVNSLKETLDNVAHDLRTPLARFRMTSEMALTQTEGLEEMKEALGEGIEASDHILSLLKNLMDIQEAESGTFYLKKENFSIKELIQDVVEMYSFIAEDKKIVFKLLLEEAFIEADRLRIFQVMSNLIDNAIKFSSENSQVQIESKQIGNKIEIAVTDMGIGISEEDISKIWDRLYRADISRSTKGTGIGLSLVKAYVEAHQGHVKVESKSAKGSRFVIILPICNE